jgi:hypothetical protein
MKTRPDGDVPARYVGDAGHYDICIRVYVRAPMGENIPSQRVVENRISDLLLAMPRLDEGAKWDVSATALPAEVLTWGESLKEPDR